MDKNRKPTSTHLHDPECEEKLVHMTDNEVINKQQSKTQINQPTTSLQSSTNYQNNNKTPNIETDPLKNTTINDSTISLHQSTRTQDTVPPFSMRDSTPPRKPSSPITDPFIPSAGNIETNTQTRITQTTNTPKLVTNTGTTAAAYHFCANQARISHQDHLIVALIIKTALDWHLRK